MPAIIAKPYRCLFLLTLTLAAFAVLSSPLQAQVFAPIPALSFTKPHAGIDPLPQTITIGNIGNGFNYSVAATTTTGGSWLSVATGSGCGLCATPTTVRVIVTADITLVAGTYSGQIVATSQVGSVTLTIPVTLTVASGAYLDNLPGQLSYSLKTGGAAITSQAIQIRNGGTGTLTWTATTSTSDAGTWLHISSASGTAPSPVTVSITVANLPGGGLTAGSFLGQLVFTTSNGSTTIPIVVVVGTNILNQVNGINFTKVFSGANPLPQTLTFPSIGTGFNFSATSYTATGGSWLSIATDGGCGFCPTPEAINASIVASPTLAVGTYTAEIVVTTQSGAMAITIPVTLTVAAAGADYFDNLAGQLSFSMITSGTTITNQVIQVRDGGTGTLSWTLTGSTSDTGNWLTISSSGGVTPALVTIGVSVANLPNGGLIAGTFIGQLVFQSPAGGTVTVPISVVVGNNVLSQINGINFTKLFAGPNPLPQTLTVPSNGTTFNFSAAAYTATGGSWLSIATGDSCGFCPTPETITVSITASPTLAAGTYTGQIIILSQTGILSMTVPVTLTVAAAGTPFFDNLAGQMSFTLLTGSSTNPPAQSVQVRNGGGGSLDWNLGVSTSDGGNWLSASTSSGTAPSTITISVQKGNLPNQGLIAGTFIGELVFRTSFGNSVTISVSVVVGANIFQQVNAISFTKPFGGANPLPQTLTMASTGTTFNFSAVSFTGAGGSWLTIATGGSCGFCATPQTINVAITAGSTLAVGTYTGEIIATSQVGSMSITVPVTLTVAAPANGAFFDNLPGQMSFSFQTGSGNPPSQTLQVRSAAPGALNWTLSTMTADGGNWLSPPASAGAAPSAVTVGIIAGNLPGLGLIAGTFTGELVFSSSGGSVAIPVSVTVGTSVFSQLHGLIFTKTFGGANPLSQTISIASTSANFNFSAASASGNGGAWLSTATVGGCGFCATPHSVTVSIVASSTLAVGTYTGQVVMTTQNGSAAMTVPVTFIVEPVEATSLQFFPVAPCRLVDTRGLAAGFNGITPFSGPSILAGGTLTIPVLSSAEASANTAPAPCGVIPSGALAYSINITVVPGAAGAVNYLSLWPAGSPQPFVSTLDDPEGLIVSNAAIVPAGTPSGGISVFNAGPATADVIIDMNGYFAAPTGLQFFPVSPCRLVDTRGAGAGFNGLVPFAGPSIAGGGSLTFPVQSTAEAAADTTPAPCGVIPSAAQAYSFNLTVVPQAGGAVDYVSLWPAGLPKPFVSTLDDPEGLIVSNAAIVPAGTPSGGVSVFNAGPATADVILDMNGYFAPPTTGLTFYPVAPCRLVDTRGAPAGFDGLNPFAGPFIPAGGTLTIPVQSTTEAGTDTAPAPCAAIPATAQAYSINITVVPGAGGAVDYVSLWPAGLSQPFVSTLDDPEGLIVANAAIVPAGSPSGGVSVFNSGPSSTDVIIDMNGYFAP
jgi:hypothetical protein